MKEFSVYYSHNEDGSKNGKVILIRRKHRGKPAQCIAVLTQEERYALIGELFNPVDAYVDSTPLKE